MHADVGLNDVYVYDMNDSVNVNDMNGNVSVNDVNGNVSGNDENVNDENVNDGNVSGNDSVACTAGVVGTTSKVNGGTVRIAGTMSKANGSTAHIVGVAGTACVVGSMENGNDENGNVNDENGNDENVSVNDMNGNVSVNDENVNNMNVSVNDMNRKTLINKKTRESESLFLNYVKKYHDRVPIKRTANLNRNDCMVLVLEHSTYESSGSSNRRTLKVQAEDA